MICQAPSTSRIAVSSVREYRDSREFSTATCGFDQRGANTMTSVGTQIVMGVIAATMNTHATADSALGF